MAERSLWAERLNGETIRRFVATVEDAAEQTIRDRRADGEMYTVERIGPEPIPYRTVYRDGVRVSG